MPVTNTAPPLRSGSGTSARKAPSRKDQRAEAIIGLGQIAQVPLLAMKQYADAGAIGMHWPKIAGEVAELAETQPAIANVIDPLMKVGPYTGLVAAILPFIMQIAVNHGRVAAGSMGTVPATSLEAQIKASMAQAELEALQVQQQAEEASRAIRDEMEQSRKAAEEARSDIAPIPQL